LQFQFYILLYEFIVDGFKREIARHIVCSFIDHSGQIIGRSEEDASLIIIKTEQQREAQHFQKNEEEPIVVFQKEV
jgi:hypothetical protein